MPTLQKIRFSVPRTLAELTDRLNSFADKWHNQLTAALNSTPAPTTSPQVATPLPTVNGSALTFGTHSNQLTSWASLAAGKGITISPQDTGKTVLVSTFTSFDEDSSASPFIIPIFSGWTFLDAGAAVGADFIAGLPPAIGSQNIIVVKKMDAGAHNIAVTPNGTDTIDDVNAAYNISLQYASISFRDARLGKWRVFGNIPPAILNATYVTIVHEPELPHSRYLVAGSHIVLTDSGAGSFLTIAYS
jgi:hypothetical protein